MILAFSLTALILSLLIINVRVQVFASVDVLKNEGKLEVSLFGITVVKRFIYFDTKCFELVVSKNAQKEEGRECKKKKKPKKGKKVRAKEILANPLIKALQFRELRLKSQIGVKDDAAVSAFAFSTGRIILLSVLSILRTKLFNEIRTKFEPCFTKNCFLVKVAARIEVRIFSLLLGIFKILLQKLKHRRSKKKWSSKTASAKDR